MKARNPFLSIILIAMLLLLLHTSVDSLELQVKGEYLSSEGILYQSYSSEWASITKLKALHNELLNNTYGEEIYALKKITIYPDFSGTHRNQLGSYQLSYRVNNGKNEVLQDSTIVLFGGNVFKTVEEMARTLSKQYGKHYTQYHILKNENVLISTSGVNSKYAELREITETMVGSSTFNLVNMAADDYVQLFGSPLARKHHSFPNMIDEFENNPIAWQQPVTAKYMYNLLPQENLDIPLAFEVDGLRDYFISLANLKISKNVNSISKPTLFIHEIKQVTNQRNSLQITFSWQSTSTANQKLNYTLVAYGVFDSFPFPIVTYQNKSINNSLLHGRYGTVVSRDTNTIYFNKHLGFYGKKKFRVFVSDASGNIVSSNELVLDLSQSPIQIIDNNVQVIDVNSNHWAFHDFKVALGYQFIKGYPDSTVRPNGTVTRAELLTILNRVNKFTSPNVTNVSIKQTVTGNHWAIPALNEAIQQNIIKKEHYGAEFELFQFDNFVTREEVAMLAAQILRSRGFNKLPNERNFIDIQNSKYQNDIRLIASYNVVRGFPDQSFRPNDYITRAQAIVIANQLFQQIRGN